MTKVISVFNEYYDIQESWVMGQISNFKHDSFIDLYLAQKEIEEAGIAAFATPSDMDKFRDNHLSSAGKKKLSSTLRTYKKRNNRKRTTRRLDVDISLPAYLALESLVREAGLTKIQLIEQLLLEAKEK